MNDKRERTRMMFELPPEIQMAIKLRAIKNQTTTGEVLREAIEKTFSKDVEQARKIIEERS